MSKRLFSELTDEEKKKVRIHYEQCMKDKTMECFKLHQSIGEFWEAHKEMDYPDW